ncbi:MAG: hypothetical protein Q9195_002503 [Heterodermia aff. obscurata]
MDDPLPSLQRRREFVMPDRYIDPPPPQPKLGHRDYLPNPVTQPSNSLLTKNQHYMLHSFQTIGRQALTDAIYKIAEDIVEEHPEAANFELLENDQRNKTWYVLQLLKTLPDKIIESLIKGTLSYDYYKGEDLELQAFVDEEMKLTHTPGIYINLPSFGKSNEGKSLSGRQLGEVLDSVERYIENLPEDMVENSDTDNFFKKGEVTSERRFAKTARSKIITEQWIARVREMYLEGLPPTDLDKPFTRGLVECGWGVNMSIRAGAHPTNHNTTYLFALYNVFTRMRNFQSPLQLALFPIWTQKLELCKIAEIVGHILCSTHWFDGGLNASWAGGFSGIETSSFQYKENQQKIKNRVQSIKNLNQDHDESKRQIFKKIPKLIEEEEAAHKEYIDLKAKYEIARKNALQRQKDAGEMKEVQDEIRELTLQKASLMDQYRSKQTTYSDQIQSFMDQANNLPRYTQPPSSRQLQSSSEVGASTGTEHTSTSTGGEASAGGSRGTTER